MDYSEIEKQIARRRQVLNELAPIDAGVWLGEPEGFPLACEMKPEDLDAFGGRYSLHGCLVSHWWGKTAGAAQGNAALGRPMGDDRYVVWTALPRYPSEPGLLPGPDLRPDYVKGVRIFPRAHNFLMSRWQIGGLCEWLERSRVPLFVWHTELEWDALYTLVGEFPRLRVIMETQPLKILYATRKLFALMKERSNVLVELSNFAGAGFIEYAVREFGAQRLIYGSFAPMNDPLVPLGMIIDASITVEEKRLLAGDNLRQLLREVGS